MDIVLWGILPYMMVVILVGGLIWRYRYDQFGWTTRSSELYESRLLRWGSPIFHYGLLVVVIGHFVGLVIPKAWTEALHVTEDMYHLAALGLGMVAGIATLGGIVILVYRRRTTGPVFMATTKNDKSMYVVLLLALLTGLATTVLSVIGPHHDLSYRDTVAPWFRSLFVFQPDIAAMSAAPLEFQIHTLVGMALFIVWPFTRLVHAFTAPIHYLFRPYIVYRSRGGGPTATGDVRRGWEPIGTPDRVSTRKGERSRRSGR
ncbi:MAG: respiratory nitrate reductase subunit gamma [Microbacterium sp.]|uniref:respiratory nitrate reductase subunit gamma n=1 Tax=Microbacterium sp. TaxID=51671 RepID=UPI003A8C1A14